MAQWFMSGIDSYYVTGVRDRCLIWRLAWVLQAGGGGVQLIFLTQGHVNVTLNGAKWGAMNGAVGILPPPQLPIWDANSCASWKSRRNRCPRTCAVAAARMREGIGVNVNQHRGGVLYFLCPSSFASAIFLSFYCLDSGFNGSHVHGWTWHRLYTIYKAAAWFKWSMMVLCTFVKPYSWMSCLVQ